jgi:mRNA-degrading endonuclease RelE of RelBE toxin-antitoxin system
MKVSVYWTVPAKESLKKLPRKVREGLLRKSAELAGGDPRKSCKPLTGSLQGFYRIVYSRYRAIFTVKEDAKSGELHLVVIFITAGIRKESDKLDVYKLARRLAEFFPGD